MKIATFGSHSALQILKGAKDEGFDTICICLKGRETPYKSFNVADEIITIEDYREFFEIEEFLSDRDAVLIPHASMVSYLGPGNIKKIKTNYFGDKNILDIESDRRKQEAWLKDSGLYTPKTFTKPEDIDRLTIIKFHGAKGGKGYFLAKSAADFYSKIKDRTDYIIQEYIIGVPVYIHYFYSPLTDELEVMSFDRRYESNVDGIGRIKAQDQIAAELELTYTIAGNKGLVMRESLLPEIFDMGEKVVRQSKKLTSKGLYGPFCLETILTPDMKFSVFEISARIVAGTNLYIDGSPYTALRYDEPMSTGRRIAREIKDAANQGKIDKVLN